MNHDVKQIFVSVDMEADGPVPGPYSMLSVGCAVLLDDGEIGRIFECNLQQLQGAGTHADTMNWWRQFPASYRRSRENTLPPLQAMEALAGWLETLGGKPFFLGLAGNFDWMFLEWYAWTFLGKSLFGHVICDVHSYAHGKFGSDYRSRLKELEVQSAVPHVALPDAIGQAKTFHKLRTM